MASLRLPKKRVVSAPARLWRRVVAFIIDVFILQMIFTPFSTLFTNIDPMSFLEVEVPTWFIVAVLFIGVIALLYFSLFELYLNATPGMQLFGIMVKEKLTFGKALLRNLYAIPVFPFTLLWIIEPIYLCMRNERLLEKITKTKTIEKVAV